VDRAQAAVAAATDGSPQQIQARYQYAQALDQSGKYPEALKEYLWLFDVGMKQSPAFAGVRVSYLVNSIAMLSRHYPPAGDELRARRDADEKALDAGTGGQSAVMEFASIDGALHENARTLAAFDKLPQGDPRRAMLGTQIFGLLLKKHRYKDAADAQPASMFLAIFEMQSGLISRFASNPEAAAQIKGMFVKNALDEIEALSGAGLTDDAKRVAGRLREFDSSKETAEAIAERMAAAPPATPGA